MSVTKNQDKKFWQDVEGHLRRSCYTRKGSALKGVRREIFSQALVLNVLAWHDLLSLLDGYSTRWIRPWIEMIPGIDLTELTACLKEADRLLLLSVADDNRSLDRFKHDLRLVSPRCGPVIGPMARALAGWFETMDQLYIDVLHGSFSFLGRLSLPGLRDLEAEALAAYIKSEGEILTDGFTSLEQDIISDWFPVKDTALLYEHWYPKHGPGSVADVPADRETGKTALSGKYKSLGSDSRIHFLNLRLGLEGLYPRPPVSFKRVSKVQFVPKSVDKLRTICMEPATLQWYQQGFLSSIVDYLKDHRYLRTRVDLENQERSHQLAWEGSMDGYYATIDLSNASDSVSWPLVRQWTKTSALREIALCCRSEMSVLPDQSVMLNQKFMPMGSALCFPFECIVFCAIVEAAILESGGRTRNSDYCVYGDDIIVESIYADAVVRRLQQNGFTVNTKKSFTTVATHNFRESCGGEYYDGFDVTPVRISRSFCGFEPLSEDTPSRITACIDMCNSCYSKLPSVRLFLIGKLNNLPIELRPIFNCTGDGGIFSVTPTNWHLKPSYPRHRFQIMELVHGGSSVVRNHRGPKADEDIRYFECLRAIAHRERLQIPEDRITACVASPGVTIWSKTRSRDDNAEYPLSGQKGKGLA